MLKVKDFKSDSDSEISLAISSKKFKRNLAVRLPKLSFKNAEHTCESNHRQIIYRSLSSLVGERALHGESLPSLPGGLEKQPASLMIIISYRTTIIDCRLNEFRYL